MYHELIYHLDLCMLTYHLHAQTLIWPLDPYLEQVATTSTKRRENFIEATHKYFDGNQFYRGPGSTQGWPNNALLDPYMCRYNRLYPWLPAFFCQERRIWLWHNTPAAITDRIKAVHMSSYPKGTDPKLFNSPNGNHPPLPGPKQIATRPGGQGDDLLYGFEGGTGSILGSPPNWSLMGFCLARAKGNGAYDVHIAFRGSRSGSTARAALAGIASGGRNVFAVRARDETGTLRRVTPGMTRHTARGNCDWVTDMDLGNIVEDPELSIYGGACRGFSAAVKSCIPNILNCLETIHTVFGRAPDVISATGHSLGGALASQFSSAMVCGTVHGPYGSKLSQNLRTWPWRSLRLITVSAPVVGESRFYTTFNSRIFTRRVMLGRDPITQEQRHYHVGSRVHLEQTPGSQAAIPYTDHHEPFKVRRSLIVHARKNWADDLQGVPCPYDDADPKEPWIVYKSFYEILQAQPAVQNRLADILAQHPAEFEHYLQILGTTFKQASTYKAGRGGWNPKTPRISKEEKDEIQLKVDNAVKLLKDPLGPEHIDNWRKCLQGIGGPSFEKYLSLSMVLAAKVKGIQRDGKALDLEKALWDYSLNDI